MPRRQVKPVAGVLAAYDGTFLQCRNIGHAWDVTGYYRMNGEVRRRLVCARCDTERLDRWSGDGSDRRSGAYVYVDGYKLDEPATTADVRREIVARAVVYASREEMLAAMTNGAKR